jgi:hypothetical protein
MGRLWYSAMVTVTAGAFRICSATSASAMRCSISEGINPATSMRRSSMGRRMAPSAETRTVRLSSGAPYTTTAVRSPASSGRAGKLAPASGADDRSCAEARDIQTRHIQNRKAAAMRMKRTSKLQTINCGLVRSFRNRPRPPASAGVTRRPAPAGERCLPAEAFLRRPATARAQCARGRPPSEDTATAL